MKERQICEYYPSMQLFGFDIVLKKEVDKDTDTIQTTINYIMARDWLEHLFSHSWSLSKEAEKQIKILEDSKKKIDSISKEAMDSMLEQAKKLLKEEE